ncbi:MAG: lysylphosphatidylglycerol synthase transmembrane domain-containing protein [Phycisphaerae bacterium]|jgi:hypothetical protein
MNERHRKLLLLCGKVVVALLLLGWVFSQVHWHDYVVDRAGRSYAVLEARPSSQHPEELTIRQGMLWWQEQSVAPIDRFEPIPATGEIVRKGFASSLKDIRIESLVAASVLYGLLQVILAYRWRLLLKVAQVAIPFWEAMRLTFLGAFFSIVVPGTVGGDLVKAYYVGKHTPNKAAALMSIIMDRVLGLTELTLLATAMLLAVRLGGLVAPDQLRLPTLMVLAVIAGLIGAFVFLLSPRFRRLLHLGRLYQHLPFAHHIRSLGEVTHLYRRNPGAMVAAVLVTFLAHVCWIGSIALLGWGLHLPTPWYSFFLYIPLIYIIGAVPLTPGGLGLVEKFYLVFLVTADCTPSMVLALALLVRLLPLLWSLPGAVVAVTGPRLPKAAAMQAELGMTDESPAAPPEAPESRTM